MKIFGIAGWSGSGKTTLVAKLVPVLTARGLKVSTLKHSSHVFEIDRPGKDSFVHRQAGATEVMISSARRWALIHENRNEAEAELGDLITRMTPVDLLLVEGFKAYPHSKIEVYREANGKPLLCESDPRILAVASDVPLPLLPIPRFELDDAGGIADFVLARSGLRAA
ncbi:MAG: molybdopterin-guanine dinucleotide biosynthesis protein B [Alphaproteobacteria bacterium]